jgi:hypothetical protein
MLRISRNPLRRGNSVIPNKNMLRAIEPAKCQSQGVVPFSRPYPHTSHSFAGYASTSAKKGPPHGFGQIVMEPTGKAYLASGRWDLLGMIHMGGAEGPNCTPRITRNLLNVSVEFRIRVAA